MLAAAVLAAAAPAAAQVQTREVSYTHAGTTLKGLIAWNSKHMTRRPGVLVVHEWWGHDEHARNQAKRLAEAGFVGFALDLYGGGKVAAHPDDAQKFMAEATKDPEVVVARFNAALAELKRDSHVDPGQTAAIGYCFGGAVVLEMARRGADLDAVVSFHGALETKTPATKGAIKMPILVLTGEADPMVPAPVVDAFRKEMDAAGAKYRVVSYPKAKHAFTNPQADSHKMEALAYDADADRKSWAEMLALFAQVFK
jgi:dienelactone hydrolase